MFKKIHYSMPNKLNTLIPFFIGLLIFLPWVGFRFVFANYYKTEESYLWYVYSDLAILTVGIIGYLIWKYYFKIEWILKLWVILYGLILFVFIFSTILCSFISIFYSDLNIKSVFIALRSFFVSPLVFLLLLFF